jgi:hypothetical protein
MPEIVPIDQGMNDLIKLHLEDDSKLEYLIDIKPCIGYQVPNVFAMLVVLELEEMENLKELCNGPISSDSLNNLEELNIKSCENLRSLFKGNINLCHLKTLKIVACSTLVYVFDLSTSQSLLLLESLEISHCELLDIIFTNERKSDDKIEVDNNKSCNSLFPKLKAVNIENCPQLQFIFPVFSAKDLLLLEIIIIENCGNLKHIFGQHQDIFPESSHSFEGSFHSISKPQTQLEVVEPIKSNKFPWSHMCCYGYKLRGSNSSSSTSNKIRIPSVYEDQPQHCSIPLVTLFSHIYLFMLTFDIFSFLNDLY